jgi:hypothetical protein
MAANMGARDRETGEFSKSDLSCTCRVDSTLVRARKIQREYRSCETSPPQKAEFESIVYYVISEKPWDITLSLRASVSFFVKL